MNAIVQRITRLYERDQRTGAKAIRATDIPSSYEAMTPQWLTDILCSRFPGAKVVDFSLGEIDNGSSNRRRVFLTYNAAGQDAGLPSSVFCKASHALINRISLGLSGAAHGETVFYNKIRPLLDIDAPRAFFAAYDPESYNSMILLEDMVGQVEFGSQQTRVTWDRAANMVRLMANYHSTMLEHPSLTWGGSGLSTWQESWARTVNLLAMEEASNRGFLAAEEVIPRRLFVRSSEIWMAMTQSVAMHDHLPKTLIHSDVHLKNWYVRGNSGMGLMDWQCCCAGHWSRDFSYAISVALSTEDRRTWERDLLALYLEETRARGVSAPAFGDAWDLYRKQLFTALAWWTITLSPSSVLPKDMQPSQTALDFIGRIARAIDDLDAL